MHTHTWHSSAHSTKYCPLHSHPNVLCAHPHPHTPTPAQGNCPLLGICSFLFSFHLLTLITSPLHVHLLCIRHAAQPSARPHALVLRTPTTTATSLTATSATLTASTITTVRGGDHRLEQANTRHEHAQCVSTTPRPRPPHSDSHHHQHRQQWASARRAPAPAPALTRVAGTTEAGQRR